MSNYVIVKRKCSKRMQTPDLQNQTKIGTHKFLASFKYFYHYLNEYKFVSAAEIFQEQYILEYIFFWLCLQDLE